MKRKLTPANEKLTKLKKFPRAQFLATFKKPYFQISMEEWMP